MGANTAPTVLDILLNDPGNDAYSYLTLFINVRDDKGYVIFFTYGSIIVAGMCNRIDAEGEPDEDRSFMDVLYRSGIFALHLEYSCAMKSHFRKFGNQMSGSGNHLCKYMSLLA